MLSDSRGAARRVTSAISVEPFDWGARMMVHPPQPQFVEPEALPPLAEPEPEPEPEPEAEPEPRISTAEIERDAFMKGYANGERAGAEAAARRGEAMLRRLAQTLDDLATLRSEMIRKTERQLVDLALAMTRRILHREVTLDRELLVTMARVAIDRLGERSSATIRLHPDDFAAVLAGRDGANDPGLNVIADPHVSHGGCRVESDFGIIDVGVEAQLAELATALLGDEPVAVPVAAMHAMEREIDS
jgi:flagellar assembly protein FliH